MKANRKFVNEEEAVSAVIGVILMVAITVAIAATVYVYVSGMIGESPEDTPEIQFTKDETNDRLVVAKTDGSTKWDSLSIRISHAGYADVNGTAAADDLDLIENQLIDITDTGTIAASDFLEFICDTAQEDVIISIVHEDTNTQLGEYTFQSIEGVA